jgi:hypothetical protein
MLAGNHLCRQPPLHAVVAEQSVAQRLALPEAFGRFLIDFLRVHGGLSGDPARNERFQGRTNLVVRRDSSSFRTNLVRFSDFIAFSMKVPPGR